MIETSHENLWGWELFSQSLLKLQQIDDISKSIYF